MKNRFLLLIKPVLISLLLTSSYGVEVNIKEGLPYLDIDIDGETVRIERIQDTKHKLKNSYTKTSRPAPPFSIQPYEPIQGIETISELEVLEFLKNDRSNNTGVLLDARMPKWYKVGTIPGAINIPFSMLSAEDSNPFLLQIFQIFGATEKKGKLNFNDVQTLLIFDNGPWCQQGVRAMKNLVEQGFPKSKIKYYRGGMQYWQILGLTTIQP